MRKLLALPILSLLGCAPQMPSEVSKESGKLVFDQNCVICHGTDGTGKGPAAETLEVRPADLTSIAARRDGVWPKLEIMSIIDGYAKRADPRPDMPIIAEVAEGPLVDFNTGNGLVASAPADLIALTEYLESIQNPPPSSYVP